MMLCFPCVVRERGLSALATLMVCFRTEVAVWAVPFVEEVPEWAYDKEGLRSPDANEDRGFWI